MNILMRLYQGIWRCVGPLVQSLLGPMSGPGLDKARIQERWGQASIPRPAGPVVWVHATNVGESIAGLPVVEALVAQRPDVHVVLTTMNRASADLMAQRLPERAFHQYMALDHPQWAQQFLDHWRPDGVIWMEADFWPSHLALLRARNIPAILLNGRLSEKSARHWGGYRREFYEILSAFTHIYAASVSDARRLQHIGINQIRAWGNIKTAAPAAQIDPEVIAHFQKALAGRALWLAASIHPQEDEQLLDVQQALRAQSPGLLMILAPRRLEHIEALMALCAKSGLRTQRRTQNAHPAPDCDVYIVDTFGELDLFYSLAPVSFLGGSLVPIGGHNVFEPIRAGSVVIIGPHTHNFHDVMETFCGAGGCLRVSSAQELVPLLQTLLKDPVQVAVYAARARQTLESQPRILEEAVALMQTYLPAPKALMDPASALTDNRVSVE